jgi:hypothetical protein
MFFLAKNSKRRKIGKGCFLAAKGKEKEGHFWCKEEIDLDLQKIKNQS